ncbi:aminotransferase class I/II-fold pyridoxal phosphate-dependent enzyme [Robiginitalea sp. M366]|uniref:pyridoxal phosphate-dependent aminotransferase n=1 Tax=Robiginitalea aestuariiviva TaxID=3036903 RepID=UPI00240CEA9F|nr:aminotransferase class I/II-fold pyridoxal phosphate-dependent enzyme [Robiginitalea aestuariiviva]MDG1570901.1 aminotransferase class I/II-fold pyridoxal phosphate-dependent enzyme [Robiginitalea aestuariiviva]
MIQEAERLQHVKEYYFSTKLREVRGMMAQGHPVINMGIGSPDLAPAPEVLHTLREAVDHAGAHQYQSYQGLPELRQTIAAFYASKFGVDLNPDTEILPLMGSKEGIMHISMAFLNPGDRVLIPNPGYPTYASVTRLVGAHPEFYTLSESHGWFPDLEALEAAGLDGVKLMWISYPHMPTGARASREQLEALVAFARRHNILLVNDNPYSFVLSRERLSILEADADSGHVLELNSLSKTFNMAGWRVGMVLGAAPLIASVLKVKSNMDSGMFYGIQKGAVAAMKSGPQWFDRLDAVYGSRRKAMYELADLLGCRYDPQAVGMFVWARLPEGSPDAETYIDHLLHRHYIFIAPGTIFGDAGEGYVRFSLCVPEERIREAIDRLAGAGVKTQKNNKA